MGGTISGSYVEFCFFGDNGTGKLNITIQTTGIQSASEIVFDLDEDAFNALYAALS